MSKVTEVPQGNDVRLGLVLKQTESILPQGVLKGLRVQVCHVGCEQRFDVPVSLGAHGSLVVELSREAQEEHGLGLYNAIVTGYIDDHAYEDGRRDITLTQPLCRVVQASNAIAMQFVPTPTPAPFSIEGITPEQVEALKAKLGIVEQGAEEKALESIVRAFFADSLQAEQTMHSELETFRRTVLGWLDRLDPNQSPQEHAEHIDRMEQEDETINAPGFGTAIKGTLMLYRELMKYYQTASTRDFLDEYKELAPDLTLWENELDNLRRLMEVVTSIEANKVLHQSSPIPSAVETMEDVRSLKRQVEELGGLILTLKSNIESLRREVEDLPNLSALTPELVEALKQQLGLNEYRSAEFAIESLNQHQIQVLKILLGLDVLESQLQGGNSMSEYYEARAIRLEERVEFLASQLANLLP